FFDPRAPETLAGLTRKGETRLVWIETPVNPVYEVVDIAAAAEAAHRAGALCTRDETLPLWAAIDQERTVGGAALGGFEAWLLLRGMRTMHLRVRHQCENAMLIARELERHGAIERVTYPGLASIPNMGLRKSRCRAASAACCRLR